MSSYRAFHRGINIACLIVVAAILWSWLVLGESASNGENATVTNISCTHPHEAAFVADGDVALVWVLATFAPATVRVDVTEEGPYFFMWLKLDSGTIVNTDSRNGPGTIESVSGQEGQFIVAIIPLRVFERGYRDSRRAMRPTDPFVENVETLKNMAHYFEARGNWPLAIAEYEKIIGSYPAEAEGVPGSHVAIAMCYMKMGEYARALDACEQLRSAYRGAEGVNAKGLPRREWSVGAYHEARVMIFEHQSDWRAALHETKRELEWLGKAETMARLKGEAHAEAEHIRDEELPERIRELGAKLRNKDAPLRHP